MSSRMTIGKTVPPTAAPVLTIATAVDLFCLTDGTHQPLFDGGPEPLTEVGYNREGRHKDEAK